MVPRVHEIPGWAITQALLEARARDARPRIWKRIRRRIMRDEKPPAPRIRIGDHCFGADGSRLAAR